MTVNWKSLKDVISSFGETFICMFLNIFLDQTHQGKRKNMQIPKQVLQL